MTRPPLLRRLGLLAIVPSIFLLTGCMSMGPIGAGTMADILLGGGHGRVYDARDLRGEVRRVDTRRQTIQLSTGRRTEHVRYDRNTRVSYGNRRYNVRNLKRGDLVYVRVDRDRRGSLYTRHIELQDRRRQDRRRGRGWFSFDEPAMPTHTVKEDARSGR